MYKASGVDKKGEKFKPYIQLNLWHHHLGDSEPLLVLQKINDEVFTIALTSHAEYFDADKMMWLQKHMAAIDWSGHEDLKEKVVAYCPKREGKR